MLKLKEIKDPEFVIEFADDDVRKFDAWKVEEDIQRYRRENPDDPSAIYASVRSAFGLPLLDGDIFTFSRQQCHEVQLALSEFLESLPVTKKALARGQS